MQSKVLMFLIFYSGIITQKFKDKKIKKLNNKNKQKEDMVNFNLLLHRTTLIINYRKKDTNSK
jgi:hypothetical protein